VRRGGSTSRALPARAPSPPTPAARRSDTPGPRPDVDVDTSQEQPVDQSLRDLFRYRPGTPRRLVKRTPVGQVLPTSMVERDRSASDDRLEVIPPRNINRSQDSGSTPVGWTPTTSSGKAIRQATSGGLGRSTSAVRFRHRRSSFSQPRDTRAGGSRVRAGRDRESRDFELFHACRA
jgi:hypothetical protein